MNRSMGALVGIAAVAGIVLLWGLLRRPVDAQDPARQRRSYDPLTERPSDEGDPGELAYRRYCAGCHGVDGDGKGPAAVFLFPKPRDFTMGLYKFVSTPGGSLPTDADLLRSITHGLKGTSMPSWRLLPLRDRQNLVSYLKTFFAPDASSGLRGIERWREEERFASRIPFHENPFDLSDPDAIRDAVAQGREVYHAYATCWQCHPAYIARDELAKLIGREPRPDLGTSVAKPDSWGQVIKPPDFRTDPLKSVRTIRDLYRVLIAGVGGTAMPTWKDALSAEQAWAMTLYVESIRKGGSISVSLEEGGDR